MDIYKTKTMLAAVKQMKPATSFLRDRYFPEAASDNFPSEEVLVDFKDATGAKLAPVVLPRKGGVTVAREGYETTKMIPPLVAPQRELTIDALNQRQMGENLFSDRTPAQRQAEVLNQDLAELDEMVTAREEYMAAKCMFENGYTLKQYADKHGSTEFVPFDMHFYTGASNPAVYTPGVMWDGTTSDKLADLYQMIVMLTSHGNAATEVLLGADAAEELMADATIKELLNIRNMSVGNIAPVELPMDAAHLGTINVRGRNIALLTYDGQYVDETTGDLTPYVPAKSICVCAPGAGRLLRGAVTQIEQSTGEWATHMGRRIPRLWTEKDCRELRVATRPLLVPRTKNPFISATVLA